MGQHGGRQDAESTTMFTRPTKSTGFAAPAYAALRDDALPALIATISLGLSIAIVLTAITVSNARAAHLFW